MWKQNPDLAQAAAHLAGKDEREGLHALDRLLRHKADRFLAGIERYRSFPWSRQRPSPTTLWEKGVVKLLDYGPEEGRPFLLVPSLVNRAYILDLDEGCSLIDACKKAGLRPLLIDWGRPGDRERGYDLDDYIAGVMVDALAHACNVAKRGKLPVVGYCMGGTLVTALALLCPDKVAGLGLLAAPWDFHAGEPGAIEQAKQLAKAIGNLDPLLQMIGELPTDILQSLFAMLDPLLGVRKFQKFAEMEDPRKLQRFVALEDWLNDGVPLAAPVARECLIGWYGENRPGRGNWHIDGRCILPNQIQCPTLHIIPANDRIVPPASALGLATQISGARIIRPPLGHIGMITGRGADRLAWRPLISWAKKINSAVDRSR